MLVKICYEVKNIIIKPDKISLIWWFNIDDDYDSTKKIYLGAIQTEQEAAKYYDVIAFLS